MKAWVKWCINHNLRWVVYLAGVLFSPLYVIYYLPDAWSDWIGDMRSIAREAKK